MSPGCFTLAVVPMVGTLDLPTYEAKGRRMIRFNSSQSGRTYRRGMSGRQPPLHKSGHPKLSGKGREGGQLTPYRACAAAHFLRCLRRAEHANLAENTSA